MRSSIAAACIVLAGCGARPPRSVAAESCRTGPVTLWLDFDGASVVHAAADDSSTTPVQSLLVSGSITVPPFAASADARLAIVDRVRTLFRPFAVDVVASRPAAAPYTRVLVGGSSATLGFSSAEAGIALVDSGNTSDSNVAFVFADDIVAAAGGEVEVANVAAHEAGHTFGLDHVADSHDVMYAGAPSALPDLFALRFGDATTLDCNVGASTGGDVTPPTIDWSGTTTITATASDDVGVVRVEAYSNLSLAGVATAPPYGFTIAGAPAYVTVEAIDAAANRASLTRMLAAPVDMAAAPDLGPPPDLATAPPRMHGGCSFAP